MSRDGSRNITTNCGGRAAQVPIGTEEVIRTWNDKLKSWPSLFIQLIYLSELRDKQGRYRDPSLKGMSAVSIDDLVRKTHYNVFIRWLGMRIDCKINDLRPYLTCLPMEDPESLLGLSFDRIATGLLPRDLSINEVRLFADTVQSVMELLINSSLRKETS